MKSAHLTRTLGLGLLLLAAVLGGCGQEGPVSPDSGADKVRLSNRTVYQPAPINPGFQPHYQWKGIWEDILSGDPRRVDAGFAAMEQEAPGTANDMFQSWAQQSSSKTTLGSAGFLERTQEPAPADGDEVTICTQVTITIEATVKEGTTVTYDDGGLFSASHTWNQDESVSFSFDLSYETTAPAGSQAGGSMNTSISYDGPIEWSAPGGTPSIDGAVDIEVTIVTVVETKE